jgi:hypothetical protein
MMRYFLPGISALMAALTLQAASPVTVPVRPTPSMDPGAASFARDVLPFLSKHCFVCHGNGKKRGELSLDKYKSEEAVLKDAPVWENVLHMVRTGEMPPKERPRPPALETQKMLGAIEAVLAVDCSRQHSAGRVTLHRLNRAEYNNTIRDLVGIDFKPAADFPADDVGYGFDNIGDVLSVSPLLLEKYLIAAEEILDRAIVLVNPSRPTTNRLDGLRVSFRAGEQPMKGMPGYLHSEGQVSGQTSFEEGDYIIRAQVYAQQVGKENVRAALRVGFKDVIKDFEVKGTRSAPDTIEAKVHFKAGTGRIAVSFLNPFKDPVEKDPDKQQRRLYVRSIVADGPYNPPPPKLPETHVRLMAHPAGLLPREAARVIVSRFATRAFRRPVTPEEVERLLQLYDKAQKDGERFENRVRLALYRVLVSPHFLFRVELDPSGAVGGKAYPISEYALASRLSYFLWSSMPDAELFGLAAQGNLLPNLEAQVRRMLKDPKSAAFVENFAGQWLTLRNLANVSPDPKVFPGFDADLRAAMHRETELFFEAIVREDRSILDLLDADFSFVNERLAKHYGISGIKGKAFQRVKLPPTRGGILTQASILTLTSYPDRTSPVLRGKWVLEQVLNTPPPPPPPDVPPLEDSKRLTGSLRQVMELHRKNALCASCHNRMDPIGFAFENYDAVGAWREKDGKFVIDPSGQLPDGKAFKGPGDLKTILKGKKDLFSRCLAEKVLTYALGRGLEPYDKCAVDGILPALENNEYRFSTLLVEVVKSEPFLMRTAMGRKQ